MGLKYFSFLYEIVASIKNKKKLWKKHFFCGGCSPLNEDGEWVRLDILINFLFIYFFS